MKNLLQLKEEIDRAQTDLNKLEGRRQALMEQLKKEFNCSTIEEAETLLEEKQTRIKSLKKKFDEGLMELNEKLEAIQNENS